MEKPKLVGSVTKLGNDWSPKGPAHLLNDSVCLGHGLQAASEASQLLGIDVKYQLELVGGCQKFRKTVLRKLADYLSVVMELSEVRQQQKFKGN